jgi:formamidopyrimidine-DNA glycosylase
MPELPDVEAARLLIERVGRGRRIVDARCADDHVVFEGASPAKVRRALVGRTIVAAHRHGKHLWLELDRRPWPVFHFGMTGGFQTRLDRGVRLVSASHRGEDGAWPPRFTRLLLELTGGRQLVFADARRLGRIRLRRDPPSEPPVSALGFDALRQVPSPAQFRGMLRRRSAPIKAVLLDQSVAAGVGNWIADEVLYQARLDPRRRAHTLSEAELRRLLARLRGIVGTAVRVGSDRERFPRTWLFHYRWRGNKDSLTRRGEKIRYVTVGGRTTAWVPAAQH